MTAKLKTVREERIPEEAVRRFFADFAPLSGGGFDYLEPDAYQHDTTFRLKVDENGFERLVFAEVIIPEVLNSWGDYHTRQSVRDFAYAFTVMGFGIDVDHDNADVSDRVFVVETFIARSGDPDFIEGSWVVGMYVGDDDVWQKILDGEITGYSYEAMTTQLPIEIDAEGEAYAMGVTSKDLFDSHTHNFFVLLNEQGLVVTGGTDETNGHKHLIKSTTFTEMAEGHRHTFNIVDGG